MLTASSWVTTNIGNCVNTWIVLCWLYSRVTWTILWVKRKYIGKGLPGEPKALGKPLRSLVAHGKCLCCRWALWPRVALSIHPSGHTRSLRLTFACKSVCVLALGQRPPGSTVFLCTPFRAIPELEHLRCDQEHIPCDQS